MPAQLRRRALAGLAATAALALALVGCSTTSGGSSPSASAGAGFPVTIESALGKTTIDEKPVRVATWGWSAQDAVLALGVVPVAMPAFAYGGVDGVLPWDKDAIDKLGGKTPQLLKGTDTGEVDVEEFVKARPDIILAPYSGLTQKEFDALSKIAPVVGYPDKAWSTQWQDITTIVGKALGKEAEAAQLVKDTDSQVSALAAKYPALKDKTFVYGANNQPDVFNVYRAGDSRVQLLTQLGMKLAPSVDAVDPKSDDSFFFPLSFENLSKLDSDVLVAYFGTQADVDAFTKDPLVAAMPQVKNKTFAPIVGESLVAAASAPSVLSIPWMLDSYVPKLAEAAARVG
jgi:iron complex transport system substrate-binding protein